MRSILWIYKIMTSMFDTHPPSIYVIISYVKEIRFWNLYPPTFYDNVIKIYSCFLRASLNLSINFLLPFACEMSEFHTKHFWMSFLVNFIRLWPLRWVTFWILKITLNWWCCYLQQCLFHVMIPLGTKPKFQHIYVDLLQLEYVWLMWNLYFGWVNIIY